METHGAKGYSAGCRCAACKAGWREYIRNWRHAKGGQASRVEREIAHGTRVLADLQRTDHDQLVTVPLTPLAWQILVEIQRQTRARRGEILDRLLRDFGAALLRAPDATAAA